jgi:hypothetical protein
MFGGSAGGMGVAPASLRGQGAGGCRAHGLLKAWVTDMTT